MKAVILAAGFSSRMGQLKQVMPVAGKPMVRHIAEAMLTAGLDVIVVLGNQKEKVKEALYGLSCEYVQNPVIEQGMFASVQYGCQAVPAGEGCLLTPCDCPGIRPTTIQHLQHTLEQHSTHVIIPAFHGKRGHPVGIPLWAIDLIRTLPSDTPGLRTLWQHTPERVLLVEVNDPAVIRDFDRPEDIGQL